jgi:hypothetical protein
MEDVGTFYGHLVYFMAVWYTFRQFGIFYGRLVYFSRFGILKKEKFGNPAASQAPAFTHTTNFSQRSLLHMYVPTHVYIPVTNTNITI